MNLLVDLMNRLNTWNQISTVLRHVGECFEEREVPLVVGDVLDAKTSEAKGVLLCALDDRMRLHSYTLNAILPGARIMRDRYVASESTRRTRAPYDGVSAMIKSTTDDIRRHIISGSFCDLAIEVTDLLDDLSDYGTSAPLDRRLYELISDFMLIDELWSGYKYH